MMKIRELFYGRRKGRPLRPATEKLRVELLPQVGISLPQEGFLAPSSLFPSAQDIWLEFGFGHGEHLAKLAQTYPEVGLIGCEAFVNGVGALLTVIHAENISNIRIYPEDGRPLLRCLATGSLGKIFILFPDPWPKARHHKRRIITPPMLDLFARLVRPGGEMRLATDDEAYSAWMVACFSAHPDFLLAPGTLEDWQQRPPGWPRTCYEEKALKAGKRCAYLTILRR